MSKRAKKVCTIQEKFKALQDIKAGESKSSVAGKYGVPKSTISTWLLPANKEKIETAFSSGSTNLKRKRLQSGKHENIEDAVFKWFLAARSASVPVSGLIIQEKANYYADKLGITDFKASNGWLDRWKARFNVAFKTISGEAKSCTPDMIAHWKETHIPTILSRYQLKDIFNGDEFGLFYQAVPKGSMELKGEKCVGGKHSKVRITGMCAANAVGEKLPLLVIGKSKNPRCFKNIKSLPCQYKAQQKAWMDGDIFWNWVKQLDRKFLTEGRNVALIVDNCPAHPEVLDLQSINLIFLPPNTTSMTQPMDQGVIRSLKAKYRRKVVQKYIMAVDSKKDLPKFTVLDAMMMLTQSWNEVSENTIVNCFNKAGISSQSQSDAVQDMDDPFIALKDSLDELSSLDPTLVDTDAENFLDVDSNVLTSTATSVDDEEILAQYKECSANDDIDHDTIDTEDKDAPVKPKLQELYAAVDVLERYSLYQEEDSAREFRKLSSNLNKILGKCSARKQTLLDGYFNTV